MPPRKATGTNTAHSTSTIATTAPDTSRIASSAASNGAHLLLAHQALDVLQHHDGVVHHDADREHQREQRERVDA